MIENEDGESVEYALVNDEKTLLYLVNQGTLTFHPWLSRVLWIQNVRGHHVVPQYVLRAVPEAPVSTPLRWSELSSGLDPQRYNIKTIFNRLAKLDKDPVAPLLRMYREL